MLENISELFLNVKAIGQWSIDHKENNPDFRLVY